MTTKYSLGEKVWVLHNEEIKQVEITRIFKIKKYIFYSYAKNDDCEKGSKITMVLGMFSAFREDNVFKTKEELIASL